MEINSYIEELKEKYVKYFDVECNINILDEYIDMFAKCNITNNRTLITKNDVVDSYENNEYCFIKKYPQVTMEDISKFIEFLITANRKFVMPQRNHMSTYITGIMVVNTQIEQDVEKYVRNFKHNRIYKLYLNGWSEIRLILTDLSRSIVITNKSARAVKKVYQIAP